MVEWPEKQEVGSPLFRAFSSLLETLFNKRPSSPIPECHQLDKVCFLGTIQAGWMIAGH